MRDETPDVFIGKTYHVLPMSDSLALHLSWKLLGPHIVDMMRL